MIVTATEEEPLRRRVLLVMMLSCALSVSLGAQQDTLLRPDARVRVWSAQLGHEQREGVVIARSSDTLWLHSPTRGAAESPTMTLPFSAIDSLELRARTPRGGARRGALRGTLIGGSIATVLGFTSCNGSDYSPCTDPGVAALVIGMGAGAGAVVGGLVGALGGVPGWHWVPVTLR